MRDVANPRLVVVALVRRQPFPRAATIPRAEQVLRAEVDRVRIVWREEDRRQHLHAKRIVALCGAREDIRVALWSCRRAGGSGSAPAAATASGNAEVAAGQLAGVHDVRIPGIDCMLAVLTAWCVLPCGRLQVVASLADVDDAAVAAVILERSVDAER